MKKTVLATVLLALGGLYSCKNSEVPCIDQSKINPDQMCTMQYDPVCGCNQKTYSNACSAQCHGITKYVKGECPQ